MNPRPLHAVVITATLTIVTLTACSDNDTTSDTSPPLLTRDDTTVPATSPPTSTVPTTPAPPRTTAVTTSSPTTATTVTPTTTTNSRPPRQTDWVTLAQRFDDILVELYSDPQEGLERINEVCAPRGRCEEFYRTQFEDLVSRGEHVEGWDRFTVTAAEVKSSSKDLATVEVTLDAGQPPYGNIVNAAGAVVQELTISNPVVVHRWHLGRRIRSVGSVGPWRLLAWTVEE